MVLICACSKGKQGGIEARVSFSGFRPACIEVTATDLEDSSRTGKDAVVVTADRVYTVGIAPGANWSKAWSVVAVGREGSCSGNIVARDEEKRVEVGNDVRAVDFSLEAIDRDADGWVTDCDDMNPMRNPGIAESCTDGVDNDCDNSTDCGDSDCATKACDDRNPCTTGDTCSGAACAGMLVSCGNPPVECRTNAGMCMGDAGCVWPFATVGTPCDAGACDNSGNCGPADRELNCADGVDDPSDSDTLVDCLDPDCSSTGASCDAGPCVLGATCQTNTACTGTAKTCDTPGTCQMGGACNPTNGQCIYANAAPGSMCSDGNACTDESCNGSGQCIAMPKSCPGGGPCATAGCDAGGCFVQPLSGNACDDGMACTYGDTCNAGSCTGTTYMCGTPPICRQPGTCLGDGGCNFVQANNGTLCDGGWGTCQSGSCMPLPSSPFPYAPSNFNPASVTPAGAVNITCSMSFNSSDAGVTGNWCNNPAPAVFTVTMDGGVQAMLLAAQSLTVSSSGTLRLIGSRPVIIAVYSTGQTLIDGDVLANSETATIRGAGSRGSIACATQAGGDSTLPDHSGGGAGYGTPGAPGAFMNGGAPGDAGPTSPVPLLGGCPGGDAQNGAEGGNGGGALQLSVAGELKLGAGTISVSGAGGRGGVISGNPRRAGAGGGSGGVLLLEGNQLDLTSSATLTSNGGAGGEGGDGDEVGSAGGNGSTTGQTFATSGDTADQGGNGGRGGTRAGLPQTGEGRQSNGGSGGAVGRIFIRAHTSCAVALNASQVSPPYQELISNNCIPSP